MGRVNNPCKPRFRTLQSLWISSPRDGWNRQEFWTRSPYWRISRYYISIYFLSFFSMILISSCPWWSDTHFRNFLVVKQALLRATASIADAAKRGRLDKVWISLKRHGFRVTVVLWIILQHSGVRHVSDSSRRSVFWHWNRHQNASIFKKKSDSRIQPLIRWLDGDVSKKSTWGPTSSRCFSGFSTAIGCSGASCCVGPIGTKALARGFSVGRTDGAGRPHGQMDHGTNGEEEVKETTQFVGGNLCVDEMMK